jgi:undecaprenyl diphosphate synthase
MQHIQSEVHSGNLNPNEIDENIFNKALDTKDSFPVEMLIRTSGEHRLSDFLLWQVKNSYIC